MNVALLDRKRALAVDSAELSWYILDSLAVARKQEVLPEPGIIPARPIISPKKPAAVRSD
jgi:hypothetical protein